MTSRSSGFPAFRRESLEHYGHSGRVVGCAWACTDRIVMGAGNSAFLPEGPCPLIRARIFRGPERLDCLACCTSG